MRATALWTRGALALVFVVSVIATFVPNPLSSLPAFVDQPLHAALEAFAASAELLLGLFLLRWERTPGVGDTRLLGAGFLSVGVFSGIHAAAAPGSEFVLLRTLSNLAAAAFFGVACVRPNAPHGALRVRWFPYAVVAVSAAIGLWLVSGTFRGPAAGHASPTDFTPFTKAVNALAGATLLATAVRLYRTSRRAGEERFAPLSVLVLFLALASLSFGRSRLWDGVWWLWHAETVLASFVALALVVRRHDDALRAAKAAFARQKEVERELVAAKERAEEATRIQREFLDIASHELRTPLTSLRLLLDFERQRLEKVGEPVPDAIDRMARQSRRLGRLVDGLLDLSRLHRQVLTIHRSREDLVPLVRAAIAEFRLRAPERAVSVQLPPGPLFAEVDAVRVEQVIDNFLDNAAKYSGEGTPIEVVVARRDGRLRVGVRDRGPGVAPEEQEKLFARFYRGPATRTHGKPGMGIGLYVCREIARLHDGECGVESRVGEGSTFFLELPAQGD